MGGRRAGAGLFLGGLAIKVLDYGFELASARKNFAKIQRMQPSLVPDPVEEAKSVTANGPSKVRGRRKAGRQQITSQTGPGQKQ
ncbi:MAG: hypothetical protein DI584_00435 [Stenotrophomonas sp.]|jgi:hypothetical protein|nr:MAG: hypothetical protein DI584_00435 [Stenotrophomonas sp.]